jgi:heme oxygenase
MNLSHDNARAADPLAALRHATAERHERLDSRLPLSRDDAGLPDYAGHLCLLRAWLAPLEAWLGGYDDGPQGAHSLPPVGRLALIESDLDEPGMPAPAPLEGATPEWPRDASAAYRWGVCYVIEGSQLGGAMLYERLAGRLAPHPLRYLRGAAGGPGPRWRAFMLGLRAHLRTPAEIADATAGACAAFDAIIALGLQDPRSSAI